MSSRLLGRDGFESSRSKNETSIKKSFERKAFSVAIFKTTPAYIAIQFPETIPNTSYKLKIS
ncbi:hypothetical protein IWX84_000176 [Flavobacterium sp. CG_9.10]|nr:hypothetical protein [Flavobacterium sp. CG_9.10]